MARHSPRRFAIRQQRLAPTTVLLTAAMLVLTLASAGTAAAGAIRGDPPVATTAATPGPLKPGYSRLVDSSAVLQPDLTSGSGRHTVFVALADQGAAELSAGLLAKGEAAADVRTAVIRQRAAIGDQSLAASAAAVAADAGAVTIFRVSNAVPGLGVTADPAALRMLAALPYVVQISEIIPKVPAAAEPDRLVSAMAAWADPGVTGAGVRVGVIDTGIDYTRAEFGGNGSAATATGSWQPTAKVVGGFDFVGDRYDAAEQTSAGAPNAEYQPVPHPDPNPMDCNGHGTQVAGAIAGQGVDAGGHALGGDYDDLSGSDLTALTVTPGAAPRALLYALKVFGCSGATDAVIPALDWALDPNGDGDFSDHLDVVDLSLTGPADVTEDPETGVLDAVAQLGVLPVVSDDAAGGAAVSVRSLSADSTASGQTAAALTAAAALVGQARPSWTPEQVKAAVLNSAPPTTGAIDEAAASSATLLAYSSTNPGSVAVSFGVVPADVRQPSVVQTSAVVVQNTGGAPADLTLSYQGAVSQPGVSFQVVPEQLALPAGSSALATVTMTITPSELRHTLAAGAAAQQRNVLTGLDEARQYVSGSSGSVTITAQGSSDLHLPVTGSAKPVSSTVAADGTLAGSPAVVLTGTGVALSSPADPMRTSYNSLVSVLNLGYRSTQMPSCAGTSVPQITRSESTTVSAAPPPDAGNSPTVRTDCAAGNETAGDLQAVGAGRTEYTATDPGALWFGLSTYGNWATVGKGLYPTVNIDTNGDNTADYTVQVQAVGGTSDLLYAMLFDDNAGGRLVDIYPVNFNLGNVDTNASDTNVLLIPVDPAAIGYRPSMTSFPIRYSVATYSAYGAPQNEGTVDTTPAITFDVARPAITTAAPLWNDQGGVGIAYRLAAGLTSADALVIHLHGADGSRAQVIGLTGTGS